MSFTCPNEPYTLGGGASDATRKITMTNQGKAGDCLHDALAKNTVELEGVEYDSGPNTIILKVRWLQILFLSDAHSPNLSL